MAGLPLLSTVGGPHTSRAKQNNFLPLLALEDRDFDEIIRAVNVDCGAVVGAPTH